jgi:hypothetical protein
MRGGATMDKALADFAKFLIFASAITILTYIASVKMLSL